MLVLSVLLNLWLLPTIILLTIYHRYEFYRYIFRCPNDYIWMHVPIVNALMLFVAIVFTVDPIPYNDYLADTAYENAKKQDHEQKTQIKEEEQPIDKFYL